MKKVFILLVIVICFITSACSFSNNMDNIVIYSTTYPIEYLSNSLYSNHSTIYSTYPKDTKNIIDFKLTDKQYTDISKADLFIYNGLSENEIEYATTLLKKNKNIKIIDAAMGMEIAYGLEELWLDPSNMMMLLQNIRNGLNEYITSTYLKDDIELMYEQTKLLLSELDVEVKDIANNSSKTLIVGNRIFKFLEKYGYQVISVADDEYTTAKDIEDAKSLIKKGQTKYIFTANNTEKSKNIITLEALGAQTLELNMLHTISANQIKDKDDYISILKNNYETIKKELYR